MSLRMYPPYYMHSDLFYRLQSPTTQWCFDMFTVLMSSHFCTKIVIIYFIWKSFPCIIIKTGHYYCEDRYVGQYCRDSTVKRDVFCFEILLLICQEKHWFPENEGCRSCICFVYHVDSYIQFQTSGKNTTNIYLVCFIYNKISGVFYY